MVKEGFQELALKLLLAANSADADNIESMLGQSTAQRFEMHRADTVAELLNTDQPEDVILFDLSLLSTFNKDIFASIHSHFPHTPILLLVESGSEATAFELVQQGAVDYLVKGQFSHLYLAHVINLAYTRNLAETAEKKAQQRLEMAISHAGIGIWEQDLVTHEIWRSPVAAWITGRQAEEMKTFQDFIQVMHQEDRPRFRSYVRKALKVGELRPIEYRIIRPDGEVRWLECQGQVIQDEAGRPARVIGLTSDVTERKAMETLLSLQMEQTIQSEARYKQQAVLLQSILDRMDEGVIVADRHGNCLAMNPAAKKMCHRRSLKGPPEQWPKAFGAYRPDRKTLYPAGELPLVQAMQGKSVKAVEMLLRHPRLAQDIWICVSAGPLYDNHGSLLGGMIVFRDITQAKQTEQSLHELSAHLRQAREEERKHIAREVHDDLGGLLTALKLAIYQYLSENQTSPDVKSGKAQSRLALVEATMQSIRRIINDLRPSILDNFGLWAALEWQGHEFQARTGIHCAFRLHGPEQEMDQNRAIEVFRVVQEALTNVAKHANATQVRIDVWTDKEKARIRVADNGQGMSKDALLKEVSYGICGMRERMQSIGGRLEIKSSPAKGTTITTTFPID